MGRLAGAVFITILIGPVSARVAGADGQSLVPIEWLRKKVTVAEAEASNPGISDDRAARFPEAAKPFGFLHSEWEALKAKIMPGDELWTFASPAGSWKALAGRAGIVLIRDGKPMSIITTRMN